MRISPIIAQKSYVKKSPNFKAEVILLPSNAEDNQPVGDKIILEKEAVKIQKELQKKFPDKNDNIQIALQPSGFRDVIDGKYYFNFINAFLGYKDEKQARLDILKYDGTPPSEDYRKLKPETIEKLKNKDSEIMDKLSKKYEQESNHYTKEEIEPYLKKIFVNTIESIIKNSLPFTLLEWEKPTYSPPIEKRSNADFFIFC